METKEIISKKSNSDTFYEDINRLIISTSDFIKFLLHKEKFIIKFLSVVIFSSVIFMLLLPNKYTTTVSFILPSADRTLKYEDLDFISKLTSPLPFSNSPMNLLKNPNDIYIGILDSRKFKENIINEFGLMQKLENEYIEDTLKVFDKMVEIEEKSGLFKISIETKDPELSLLIAKQYTKELSVFLSSLKLSELDKIESFIKSRLEGINSSLEELNKKLQRFQGDNLMVNFKAQSEVLIQHIASLENNIILAEAELEALKTNFTRDSSKVKAVESKIYRLKDELQRTKGKELEINNSGDKRLTLATAPELGTSFLELSRDVKVLEELFVMLTQEHEIIKLSKANVDVNLKIVDEGSLANKKSSPNRSIYMLLILFISSVILFFILLFDYFLLKLKEKNSYAYERLITINEEIYSESVLLLPFRFFLFKSKEKKLEN